MAKKQDYGILLNSAELLLKHIPKASTADDILSIYPQFFTKTGYVDIDSTVSDDDACPNGIHQLLA
jgi:hypothetical protein